MDLILYNGNVYTMDDNVPRAEAIAVSQGRIAAVGSNERVKALQTAATQMIDLGEKAVVPGLNDSHVHLLSYGLSLQAVDLNSCRSIEDVQKVAGEYVKDICPSRGRWIEGRGWNQNYFKENRMLERKDLDRISLDHPIMFKRTCGQVTVVNSTALSIIEGSVSPQEIGESADAEKDSEGRLTGLFRGNGQELVYQVVPRLSVDEIKDGITAALNNYAKGGLTSVQTNDFELKKAHFKDVLKAYEELDLEERLPVRVNLMVCLPEAEDMEELIRSGYRTGTGTPTFRIGPYTLQTDGSLGARTAALTSDYADDPGNRGVLYYDEEEFTALMELAWINGFQVAADGIGDRGMELALETFAYLQDKHPKKDPRSCVDHCQITTPSLLQKFSDYQVVGGLEVVFVSSDLMMVEQRVGPDRARWSYHWKGFMERGIPVAFGSDSPVESHNPFWAMHAAIHRQDEQGQPPGGWFPDQCLDVNQALHGYTLGSAYATHEEKVKGSITVGKEADLVVLSDDMFTIPTEQIKDVRPVMTLMSGVVRYRE